MQLGYILLIQSQNNILLIIFSSDRYDIVTVKIQVCLDLAHKMSQDVQVKCAYMYVNCAFI